MVDYKTAFSPFCDAGFRHQFVAMRARSHKPRPQLHHRNTEDIVEFEQLSHRKSRRAEQRNRTLIEPAKIVRVEDDIGRITISEFDLDSNTIHEHVQRVLQQENRAAVFFAVAVSILRSKNSFDFMGPSVAS